MRYTLRLTMCLLACVGLHAPAAVAGGDAVAGKAKASTCGACHGQDGVGISADNPNLAGQNERYLVRQLQMIQDGSRPAPLMAGQLDGKSPQDLEDMAAYYAAMPAPVGQAPDNAEQLALGERIYRAGIRAKTVAACTACHSPTGAGNAPAGFPQVGGQQHAYVVDALKSYREGRRQTDESYGGMMRGVAARLTDTEIEAVASYIQGLH